MERRRLIADIGGTNARFALADSEGEISEAAILPVAGFPTFEAAMAAYFNERNSPVGAVAIAAAGPRDGDSIVLTNAPWRIESHAISELVGGAPVLLLNDLEAVALCLPSLGPGDLDALETAAGTAPRLPLLAANVGTGFGAAVAIPARAGWVALGTEAGHMTLNPASPAESALLTGVRSAEEAFSGPGYARLFGAAVAEGGESVRPAEDDGGRRRILYSELLGRFIGDLVLATGAWGGVYLCGGVVSDLRKIVDIATFLDALKRKGKMAPRMAKVPVFRIVAEAPAFRYLASAEIC